MTFAVVFLESGDQLTGGWESVRVMAALNEAARAFEIEVTEIGPFGDMAPFSPWLYPPGTAVAVITNSGLLVTGYINTYAPSGDATSHKVRIAGRGKGQDYADCSAEHPTGRFDNKKIEEIAAELDVYGVGVSAEVDTGPPVPWFQIRQGESPHSEMLRLAQQRRLTMKGRADGSIVFTRGGVGHHAGGLIQGQNIERLAATISDHDRFSVYKARGQSSHGTRREHLRPAGEANDGSVRRHRPKIIIDHADTDKKRLDDRAMWEAKRAAGFSVRAEITVPSFCDDAGMLWEPGWTVFVFSPWLKIEQDMLIERAEFQLNDRGTAATLGLVDPRAYDAQGGTSGGGAGGTTGGGGGEGGGTWYDEHPDSIWTTP